MGNLDLTVARSQHQPNAQTKAPGLRYRGDWQRLVGDEPRIVVRGRKMERLRYVPGGMVHRSIGWLK